jgi:alpha-ketoglutarate-dependent 2,4-dichlorophenoxyacetate dioxygenase
VRLPGLKPIRGTIFVRPFRSTSVHPLDGRAAACGQIDARNRNANTGIGLHRKLSSPQRSSSLHRPGEADREPEMQINPLHPLFAAEIIGLDTSAPVTPETIKIVEDAMAEYAVCVIRGASLKDEDQIRFSRAFGSIELPPVAEASRRPNVARELFDVTNLDANGEIAPNKMDAKTLEILEGFHTDSPFNSLPTKWSLLLGHVVPPEGANTNYIDTRAVYQELPQAMKDRIEGLVAVHDLFDAFERRGVKFGSEAMRKAYPAMSYPLVRTSANGRKALYFGWHAVSIVGLSEEEGSALIEELYRFATQERFIYSHKWRQGDLVIWDNRCTMHAATPFERNRYKRDCRRATINEDGAEGATVEPLRAAV